MKNYFETLTEKERKVVMSCLKRFFYARLPTLNKLSNNNKFRKICGGDVKSLGIEGAFEAFLNLFVDGTLKIVYDNVERFAIWTIEGNKVWVIYDSMEDEDV